MGTLNSNPTAAASFDGQIFKKGLDLTRSIIGRDLGTEVAGPTATIRAGMLVTRDNAGYIQPATGADVYAVAKWGKEAFANSVAVDQPVILSGTVVTPILNRGSLSSVTVRSAVGMAGVVYISGTDYTLNAGNGTLARIGGGAITDGQTVYVTATFALTQSDFDIDGRFFQNQNTDRTAYQDGRITTITDWSRLFTIEWQTLNTAGTTPAALTNYTLQGQNSKLYCSATGQFTNDPALSSGIATREFVGRVYQVPTAQDPYMGVTAHGNPTNLPLP